MSISPDEQGNDEVIYSVTKYASYLQVSDELMIDALPFIGPQRPPIVPTRWQKIRWRTSQKVAYLRLRLGSWIAGVDPAYFDD